MADINEKVNGVYGGVSMGENALPAKTGFWSKIKTVLFSDIKVELTPYQQKIEDEINEFLHQEITWAGFKNFLFQEVEITHKGKRIL